jgi:hypothetical protein
VDVDFADRFISIEPHGNLLALKEANYGIFLRPDPEALAGFAPEGLLSRGGYVRHLLTTRRVVMGNTARQGEQQRDNDCERSRSRFSVSISYHGEQSTPVVAVIRCLRSEP